MKTLSMLVLLIEVLTWVECAPFQNQNMEYGQLGNPDDESEQFQLTQEHEDILDNLQQQEPHAEDLQQYQQELSGRLEDFRRTQEHQQTQNNDDGYLHQSQVGYLERFPEPYGQLREAVPNGIQQSQPEDFDQYQQGLLPVVPQPAHIEDLGQEEDDIQKPQSHDTFLREYDQQSQAEELNQYREQQEQIQDMDRITDDSQQIQDHDSFIDDSQQRYQVEDLSQFQQGKITNEQQLGRLEDLGDDTETFQQHQEKQTEDLSHYPEQQGQIQGLGEVPIEDEAMQIQDHDSFIDDSQQKSQVEDLSQFQQGKLTNEQQSGRLEDLGDDTEIFQQTQEKQTEDLSHFPEQQGQIRDQGEVVIEDEAMQTQDHDSFIDDSQQQSQVEDLSQFQQGRITNEQQSGRLEDLGDDTETFQETQEKQTEDLYQDQELGQIRQGVHGQDSAEFFDESVQQTQNEDLSAYSIGQVRTEPKIPALQISQVRHEQQPYSYNAQNVAAEVESHEIGRSSLNKEAEQVPLTFGGELNQQPSHYSIDTDFSSLNIGHHFTTPAPGFWKRLGSKIESAYGKAKDKGRQIIHSIKESVG